MVKRSETIQEYRPRLIIWQIAPDGTILNNGQSKVEIPLNKHERLLTLEGIASVSKPIVVLTGEHILHIPDIFEMVQYGHALGLKMIIEAPPLDLTIEVMRKYEVFGSRIFRVLVDGCVIEDMDTRYRQSQEFFDLEHCITNLRKEGFEIHFSLTVTSPDSRALGFSHDFAYRTSARGLYCHLSIDGFNNPEINQHEQNEHIEEFIESIAKIKRYSPEDMYFSPQCVQYGYMGTMATAFIEANGALKDRTFEWRHSCLGGKRFAFISSDGKVQLCKSLNDECGDLRKTGFDFESIWLTSDLFERVRKEDRSCAETRHEIKGSELQQSNANNVIPV